MQDTRTVEYDGGLGPLRCGALMWGSDIVGSPIPTGPNGAECYSDAEILLARTQEGKDLELAVCESHVERAKRANVWNPRWGLMVTVDSRGVPIGTDGGRR